MISHRRKLTLILTCIGALIVGIAPAAEAAVTCRLNGTTLEVAMTEPRDMTSLRVDDAGAIEVRDLSGLVPCVGGTPTVTTVDHIEVVDTSGGEWFDLGTAVIVNDPERFAPGATDEPGTDDEIEFTFTAGEAFDSLSVSGAASAPHAFVVGAEGVNLNASEAVDDVDVVLAGVDRIGLGGGAEDDVLSLGGGEATGMAAAMESVITGRAGDDSLVGGDGRDVIRGLAGDDDIAGGAGRSDALLFDLATAGVSVNFSTGVAEGEGSDRVAGIEQVWGSTFGDVLIGDAGDNLLIGLAGDDRLVGLGGADVLAGADGFDTVAYRGATRGVEVDLRQQDVRQSTRGAGRDLLSDIEAVSGSRHADELSGNSSTNRLDGLAGDDVLRGFGGPDALYGRRGNDRLSGGVGVDDCYGGPGRDIVRRCER